MANNPEASQNAPVPPFPPFPEPKPPEGLTLLPALQVEAPSGPGMPPEIAEVKKFASSVLAQNAASLQNSSQYLRISYVLLLVMYCTLFVVGVATAVAAIIKGITATNASEALSPLIFAGLSAASFLTLFIVRPLESLERNAIFSTWVVAALNTYWTQLMYFDDPKTIYTDLKSATDDLVATLSALSDKYATAIGKYAPLSGAASTLSSAATTATHSTVDKGAGMNPAP